MSPKPDLEIRGVRLGEAMTLNVAVGNTDGHARNHAFLLHDQVVELAPLYDVAPTFLFVTAQRLGLWVDGQAYYRHVSRGHLVREMRRWSVSSSEAQDTVERTLTAIQQRLGQAAGQLEPFVDDELLGRTSERVESVIASSSADG